MGSDSKTTEALHGGDVYRNEVRIDFSVNLDPLPMPSAVAEAMLKGISEIHQYPDPFQQKLRQNIARLEGVSPEEIICGSGASELLMASVHAFMPRKALVTAPCYAGYARALEASGAEIREYPLSEEMGFVLDDGILDFIDCDTGMVFIADPNNPNGKLIDPDLKRRIAAKCEETGTLLLFDECFFPLTEAGLRYGKTNDRSNVSENEPVNDSALHLRAFTKTIAIPGIRIGYLVCRDPDRLQAIRTHLPEWNVSRIAERTGEAAAEALAGTDHLKQSVRYITKERTYLSGELERLGIRAYPSDTNFILFRSGSDLYDRLLEKGILIRRCANFSGLDDTYFRIAVRTHEDNEELIRTLGDIL